MNKSLQEFAENHQHSHLILDTCSLIDLRFIDNEDLYKLLELFSDNQIILAANQAVRLELLKNSKSQKVFQDKEEFYSKIIKADLVIDKNTLSSAIEMALIYGPLGKDVDFVDFILAGCLKRYSSSEVFLMTSNHKHYPLDIFNRVTSFTIEPGNEIRAVAIYQYSEEKITNRLQRVMNMKSSAE